MGFETLSVAVFELIDCKTPAVDQDNLYKYQKYVLDICLAIKTCNCANELFHRNLALFCTPDDLQKALYFLDFMLMKHNPNMS